MFEEVARVGMGQDMEALLAEETDPDVCDALCEELFGYRCDAAAREWHIKERAGGSMMTFILLLEWLEAGGDDARRALLAIRHSHLSLRGNEFRADGLREKVESLTSDAVLGADAIRAFATLISDHRARRRVLLRGLASPFSSVRLGAIAAATERWIRLDPLLLNALVALVRHDDSIDVRCAAMRIVAKWIEYPSSWNGTEWVRVRVPPRVVCVLRSALAGAPDALWEAAAPFVVNDVARFGWSLLPALQRLPALREAAKARFAHRGYVSQYPKTVRSSVAFRLQDAFALCITLRDPSTRPDDKQLRTWMEPATPASSAGLLACIIAQMAADEPDMLRSLVVAFEASVRNDTEAANRLTNLPLPADAAVLANWLRALSVLRVVPSRFAASIRQNLRHADPDVRIAAAQVAGRVRGEDTVDLVRFLAQLAAEPEVARDGEVELALVQSISEASGWTAQAMPTLIQLVRGQLPVADAVRQAAADALVKTALDLGLRNRLEPLLVEVGAQWVMRGVAHSASPEVVR